MPLPLLAAPLPRREFPLERPDSRRHFLFLVRPAVKSQGEIEASICDGISRFQQEFIGRGPRDIHAHLVGSLLVVRLQGVLTPAERQLIAQIGRAHV